MISPVDIANRALGMNDMQGIVSLEGDGESALMARDNWTASFETFLVDNDKGWSFAKKFDRPARLVGNENDPLPYLHAYSLPEDCIRVIEVGLPERGRLFGSPGLRRPEPVYEIMRYGDSRRQALHTDAENIVVTYVSNRTLLDDFSPLAIEALTIRLAAAIAVSLKSFNRYADLLNLYETVKNRAILADTGGRNRQRLANSDYDDSRIW